MSIEAMLVWSGALLMTVGAALWIAWPLWRGEVPADPPDPRAIDLLSRREATLATLRDLESDHADGLIGDEDYQVLHHDAVAEGASVLAQLDELTADLAGGAEALASEIEADVARVRGAASAAVASEARSGRVRTCPECGQTCGAEDRFCASCGAALPAQGQ